VVEYEIGCGKKRICPPYHYIASWRYADLRIYFSWSISGDEIPSRIRRFSAWNHDFCTCMRISRLVRHWLPFERVVQHTRRLRLYELQRKEPLYNPRWPPPRRGLLLANTKQEAPPWLTARDGMIYWDFCLFAPALQRTHHCLACLDGRYARICDIGFRHLDRVQLQPFFHDRQTSSFHVSTCSPACFKCQYQIQFQISQGLYRPFSIIHVWFIFLFFFIIFLYCKN